MREKCAVFDIFSLRNDRKTLLLQRKNVKHKGKRILYEDWF